MKLFEIIQNLKLNYGTSACTRVCAHACVHAESHAEITLFPVNSNDAITRA